MQTDEQLLERNAMILPHLAMKYGKQTRNITALYKVINGKACRMFIGEYTIVDLRNINYLEDIALYYRASNETDSEKMK
uniref:DNA-binding protein n=1 Tax=Heterorhabditis bacteriophora TaxID=37862 RepID=A0A1I7WTC0_HETBA